MRIYIPTRGRSHRQETWNNLPKDLQEDTILICPGEEYGTHTAKGRICIVCPVEGIINKRQWMMQMALDSGHEKIILLDDDLIFLARIDESKPNLRQGTEDDIRNLFYQTWSLVDSFVQVGVSPRQGNNRFFPSTVVTCNRVTNFHAYDVKKFFDLGLSFKDPKLPDTFTMEDFHVTLSLLESGNENCVITDFAWDQIGDRSNSSGGCSIYRTPVTQTESALLLHSLHPDFVRLTEKTTKGGWAGVSSADGGGSRLDVTIYWKKAYKYGCEKKSSIK